VTAEVKSWLPFGVLARKAIKAPIGAAVGEWSTLWFGRRFQTVNFRPTEHKPWSTADDSGWLRYGGMVALSYGAAARDRLIGSALDCPFASLALSPADEEVVGRFEADLFGDLAARIEAALGLESRPAAPPRGLDAPFGPAGGLEVEVRDPDGHSALRIAAPLEAVMPLCKASLPPPRRRLAIRSRRSEAIGAVQVTLQATLGHAEVGLADLRRLTQGDVLVLDRTLDEGAILASSDNGTPLARARLGADGDRMTLTVQIDG